MKKTNKIIVTVIIVAMLLLGIGYAAIQNITLNIEGTATADPSQSNFSVKFTGTPKVSDSTYVTAGITDDINATISVSGLTQKGQTVNAEYTVQNVSTDISADLSVATTNSNTEYFTLKSELAKTSLTAGEATTVKVTVELTKTPIAGSVNSTIGVRLTAMPVEPGKEGTSEGINGSSQTPETSSEPSIGDITNDNIGEYIDLGNNIVGTEATTDDWRIFYKEGDTVYAILADYLPAEQVPASAGLDTDLTEWPPYSVWSNTDRDTLLNGLKNETAWSSLANGISGATVTGTPTAELLMSSYNAKNGTNLVYTDEPRLDSSTEDYNLYVPHTEIISNNDRSVCFGYRLASISNDEEYSTCMMYYSGGLHKWAIAGIGEYNNRQLAVRPVVSLPSSIPVELVDGVWTVSQ